MSFMFESLKVYKKALEFADQVLNLSKQFPKEYYFLTDQFRRAATSISLNIAEGNGRFHQNERNRFFLIARSSACECVPILELCLRNKLVTGEARLQLRSDLNEIGAMLTGLIRREQKRESKVC